MDHYTLGDLLGHWERGELTMEEVIARWAPEGVPNDALLHELLRALACLQRRIMVLEGRGRTSMSWRHYLGEA